VGPTCRRGVERERVPLRGRAVLGRGLLLGLGRMVSPGSNSIFISFFLLFFSVFLNLLYLLQKGFNSIQTTFRNFLKFKIIILNSNKQVFLIKTTFNKNQCEMAKGFICIMQMENEF
jgi:hypothetical protein